MKRAAALPAACTAYALLTLLLGEARWIRLQIGSDDKYPWCFVRIGATGR